jgi:hypothetical protein
MGSRLMGLGAALFSLAQVLGSVAGMRRDDGEALLVALFYAAVWVCGLRELFGAEHDRPDLRG